MLASIYASGGQSGTSSASAFPPSDGLSRASSHSLFSSGSFGSFDKTSSQTFSAEGFARMPSQSFASRTCQSGG